MTTTIDSATFRPLILALAQANSLEELRDTQSAVIEAAYDRGIHESPVIVDLLDSLDRVYGSISYEEDILAIADMFAPAQDTQGLGIADDLRSTVRTLGYIRGYDGFTAQGAVLGAIHRCTRGGYDRVIVRSAVRRAIDTLEATSVPGGARALRVLDRLYIELA